MLAANNSESRFLQLAWQQGDANQTATMAWAYPNRWGYGNPYALLYMLKQYQCSTGYTLSSSSAHNASKAAFLLKNHPCTTEILQDKADIRLENGGNLQPCKASLFS
jgi:hypothetical protein